MPFDPEIAPFAELLKTRPAGGPDWPTMRAQLNEALVLQASLLSPAPSVTRTDFTTTREGATISLRWYSPAEQQGHQPTAAVVYLHGGAMIAGSVDLYDRIVAGYVESTGVPFLAVDYRLAPELTADGLVRDAFTGLEWLVAQADALRVDPTRIAVMGDSAGGGIAAGTALLARENQVALARQLLIYPMLDDRNTEPDPAIAAHAFFTYADNHAGWKALLGDAVGSVRVSELAAPARAEDLTGLASAYLEVGELDIFRDETIGYAQRLLRAGVQTELHLFAGAPHGYDRIPGVRLAASAMARREDVLRQL